MSVPLFRFIESQKFCSHCKNPFESSLSKYKKSYCWCKWENQFTEVGTNINLKNSQYIIMLGIIGLHNFSYNYYHYLCLIGLQIIILFVIMIRYCTWFRADWFIPKCYGDPLVCCAWYELPVLFIYSWKWNNFTFLQTSLDEATDPWGVKVERVEV